MKVFLSSILLTLFCISAKGQLPEGNYISNRNSYRANYFLLVKHDSVTMIGWEIDSNKDTIYYRSMAANDSTGRIKLTVFSYSQIKITEDNFQNFIPQGDSPGKYFEPFDRIVVSEVRGDKISVLMIRDFSDSSFNQFEFILLK